MTLEELQKIVDDWVKANGGYYSLDGCLLKLEEEVLEVRRELTREENPEEPVCLLGWELADVIFALACIANLCGISLEDSWEEKMPLRARKAK